MRIFQTNPNPVLHAFPQGLGFIPSWQFDPSAAPGPSLSGSMSITDIMGSPLFWVAALGLGIWYFDPIARKKRARAR